jgi:hypothetical protein
MADPTDVLLHLYQEERTQARHTEEQRATLTNIVLIVVAAALAYVTSRTDDVAALIVSVGVMLLGLYGAVATGKYFERWMRHWRRAYAYQTQLLDLYSSIDSALATFSYKPLADRTDPYEMEVEERFPHLSSLKLYRLWISFHCAVALAGAVMVVVFAVILLN